MGKTIIILGFVFLTGVFMRGAFAQGESGSYAFLHGMEDIPLMAGLYEIPEESLVFDKPEGRIVHAAAASESAGREEIEAFYKNTLPHMGWHAAGMGAFARRGEELQILVQQDEGYSLVLFTVLPVPAAGD
ncbi:MAG: hypothetical protein HY370_00055 [Proteobacteria bacterium]|nr:hypothetical protein [Pseudomonadota bacterium]